MKYYCHLCKKDEAKASMTYPNVVVCRCSGKLEEVGAISSTGQYNSLGTMSRQSAAEPSLSEQQSQSRANRLNSAQSAVQNTFDYQTVQLTSLEETRKVGIGMNNACAIDPGRYFNAGSLYLFIPKTQGVQTPAQLKALLDDPKNPKWKTVCLCLVGSHNRAIQHLLGFANKSLDPAEYDKIQDYMKRSNLVA